MRLNVLVTLLMLGLADGLAAQTIEPDGTVAVGPFALPPSIYLSDEARAKLPRAPADPEAPMRVALAAGKAGEMRARIGEYMAPRIDKLMSAYGVSSRSSTLAGRPAVFMTPAKGVAPALKGKIMLNLPGGGFVMGTANGTGMVESVPLVAATGIEVVSVTYRQAPEFAYPAATDDIVSVYRELLKSHNPKDIAVFGCSAGGLLTAELLARLVREKLPLPAAAGIFCASADARWGGDSRHYSRPFQGLPANDAPRNYFAEKDLTDPAASPILDPATLAKFPPTLIVTATRAAELSSAVGTHNALTKAGVDSDLHVWDGLGHAFFYDASLPESREAFAVMARFFTRHLHAAR